MSFPCGGGCAPMPPACPQPCGPGGPVYTTRTYEYKRCKIVCPYKGCCKPPKRCYASDDPCKMVCGQCDDDDDEEEDECYWPPGCPPPPKIFMPCPMPDPCPPPMPAPIPVCVCNKK